MSNKLKNLFKNPSTKKLLQAGALGTDALSKGSAGGLGKAIVESKIDLSNPFNEQDTESNAGQQTPQRKANNYNMIGDFNTPKNTYT